MTNYQKTHPNEYLEIKTELYCKDERRIYVNFVYSLWLVSRKIPNAVSVSTLPNEPQSITRLIKLKKKLEESNERTRTQRPSSNNTGGDNEDSLNFNDLFDQLRQIKYLISMIILVLWSLFLIIFIDIKFVYIYNYNYPWRKYY